MAKIQLRFFLIAFLFLFGMQTSLYAQQTLGVIWDIPADSDSAHKQLEQFDELGISALEISELLSEEIWAHIDSLGFEVYGNLDIPFPTSQTFNNPDSAFVEHFQRKSQAYLAQSSVKAIGVFHYGNIYDSTFWQAVSSYAEEIQQAKSIELYHRSKTAAHTDTSVVESAVITISVTPTNFDTLLLPSQNVTGYVYAPSAEVKHLLTPFKNFITTKNQSSDTVIFMESKWIASITDQYPQFTDILLSISTESDPVFPLPQEEIPKPDSSPFSIIALIIIWGTVALHYNMSPLYRKSLFRYFFAHKFFIDDIFKRLIRSSIPATVILLQSAFLTALAVYSAFATLFSSLGQEAFFHHFPNISLVGQSPLSIFIWAFLLILLVAIIAILWLYFTHKKINSITQIAIVYAWPLQLNFIFCTIVVAFGSPSTPYTTVSFTILALLVFVFSFLFTALDISRFSRSKGKYHLKTTIPYSLLVAGFLGWAISNTGWTEAIKLALNLT